MPSSGQRRSGVLPYQALEGLIDDTRIVSTTYSRFPIDRAAQLQPASIDLRLGTVAYRLQSSFLPQSGTVREKMKDLVMYEIDLDRKDGAILERGAVYLIPLIEHLRLEDDVKGKTNPKSSTGRLDVFTRVITDYAARFEDIAAGYAGELFLEVVPRSFTVKVRAGQRLNQLRLFRTSPPDETQPDASDIEAVLALSGFITDSELHRLYHDEQILFDEKGKFIDNADFHIKDGLLMSVDLSSGSANDHPIGYKTKKNSQVIDLDKVGQYDAEDFWEPIYRPRNGRLILEPEEFYIFASKEYIRVPCSCASEMVEFDAGSGELRTHYAGFFDPGFGYGKQGEVKGTKAVLEVRPHDVPFIIEDGQILFKMKYERMTTPPEIWYGKEIGSNYHDQTLKLAKQFRQKL